MTMRDENLGTIPPEVARFLVGDQDALVGGAKMVFSSWPDGKTIFGGGALDRWGDGKWQMAAGTLIFVPFRFFRAKPRLTGYRIDQLLVDGNLSLENWEPKT
jgi:hypothetical protein